MSEDNTEEIKTSIFLEDVPTVEESLGISREEFRRRTAHLIPPPGGDLKPYFDEVNKISEEARQHNKS